MATITGNPQNMLIGSVSRIPYVSFLAYLGPVALVGLFVDWALVHWMYLRHVTTGTEPPASTSREFEHHRPKMKPLIVLAIVLVGFLAPFC